jgi:hypothetical protein
VIYARVVRRIVVAVVLASLSSVSSVSSVSIARADVPPANAERVECARAYEQSQRLQQSGESKKALEAAERCAQSSCPPLLAEECRPWVTQLRQQLSKLEVLVTGSDACPANDAVIEIDRVKQSSAFELLVEPGVHEVRAIAAGSNRIVEQTIDLARGERRTVTLRFAPPGAVCGETRPTGPTRATEIPKPALGLGIAGAVLLVTGVTLGVVGAVKRNELDECKPGCSSEQIDGPRTFFVAGDVIGALGLVTLGAATVAFFLGQR